MEAPVLQHSGLDDAQLGPRLARLLAPDSPLPAREMVARGLAPLPGAEPWLALYHLWVVGGATLAEHASRTAADLPASAVVSALVDPHLPAVVLDFMARRRLRSPDALRLLVHHPRVSDPTLQTLARAAPTPVCDALAHNQRRWLACPAIAIQLIHNPHCDRASAHAVLELGAREGVAALAELRREVLAGAVLQDSPEVAARLAAWLLRASAGDPPPAIPDPPATVLPARPDGAPPHPTDLSPGPASPTPPPNPATRLSPAPPPLLGARPPSLSPGTVPKPPPVPTTRPPTSKLAARPGPARPDLSPGPAASAAKPHLSSRPAAAAKPDLSSRPAASTKPDLSSRPAAPLLAKPDLSRGPAARPPPPPPPPAVRQRPAANVRPRLDLTPPAALTGDEDDGDELDLPLAEDMDQSLGPGIADIPPPAPRGSVPWPDNDIQLPPPPPRRPEQRSLFSDALGGAPTPISPTAAPVPEPPRARTYADRVARVLDRRTPLPEAMSLLHQLRPADLRAVAEARHLADPLVTAARRRVPEARAR